jgi:hypothetical protein
VPEQTDQARVAHVAIDRSKRREGGFMIEEIIAFYLEV